MERHQGEQWRSVEEAAKEVDVEPEALARRVAGGLVPSKPIGDHHSGSRPHVHPEDVAALKTYGLPYADLEAVEAGAAIDPPERWLWVENGMQKVFVATRIVYVGRPPSGFGHAAIGHDLPPDRWRVLGAGDLVGEGEEYGLEHALASGWVVEVPADRGVIGLLFAIRDRAAAYEALILKGDAEEIQAERERIVEAAVRAAPDRVREALGES